jgi:5-formyltetrahydrofolate cyclo-ligase
MAPEAEKSTLREVLRGRRLTGGDLAEATAAVCGRLLRLPELAGVQLVAGYAATPSELAIDDALRALAAQGVTVCIPWVDGQRLHLAAVGDLAADLAPGWRGLREPRPERRQPVRPARVDALIVPGVGFDRHGHRLGQGGGHFDRLLGQTRRGAAVIGVTFDECVVDEVPVQPHDRSVDVVVTPTRTLRPAGL